MAYGEVPYVSLEETKNYLRIVNDNDDSGIDDARLQSIIKYACGAVEHYIGQEVTSNTYIEQSAVGSRLSRFVERTPIQDVYEVKVGDEVLVGPDTNGQKMTGSARQFATANTSALDTRRKKFGVASLKLPYANSSASIDSLGVELEDYDFTFDLYFRQNESQVQNTDLIRVEKDSGNYYSVGILPNSMVRFASKVNNGSEQVVEGYSTTQSTYFDTNPRGWHHLAVTRDSDAGRMYLHFDGTLVANSASTIGDITFDGTVKIGEGFIGNIDEVRVSTTDRYKAENFTDVKERFITDADTVLLMHFDGDISDVSTASSEYSVEKDIGYIDFSEVEKSKDKNISIRYKAGFDPIPEDLKGATFEYIKLIKHEQLGIQMESIEDQRVNRVVQFSSVAKFPNHIEAILQNYKKPAV